MNFEKLYNDILSDIGFKNSEALFFDNCIVLNFDRKEFSVNDLDKIKLNECPNKGIKVKVTDKNIIVEISVPNGCMNEFKLRLALSLYLCSL